MNQLGKVFGEFITKKQIVFYDTGWPSSSHGIISLCWLLSPRNKRMA